MLFCFWQLYELLFLVYGGMWQFVVLLVVEYKSPC